MLKFVRPQSKGMVTIPIEFRQKLGITENSLLEAKLIGDQVVFVKVDVSTNQPDYYSDAQIKKWMKLDKMDKKTANKLTKLLK